MHRSFLASVCLFGLSASAQPAEPPAVLAGVFFDVGPSVTAGSVADASVDAGPGLAVEVGWASRRVAVFLGGTGGFVPNAPAFWTRTADVDARAEGVAASRSTLATMDLGAEVRFPVAKRATTPFVGLTVALPVYATERRDADRRVAASGLGGSLRLGARHRVSDALAVSASIAPFAGSLRHGFAGEERTGHPFDLEPSRVRGVHLRVGVTVRPFALLR